MATAPLRTALLAVSAVALAGAPAGGLARADEVARGGTWTSKITQQEALPLGSADRLLVAQVAVGTNKGKAGDAYLDGAKAYFSEIVQLDRGNGPQTGTIAHVSDKGTVTSHYAGTITTTMMDGQPRTTGEGTWRLVSGTGAYGGASGSGTYTFTMVSQTDVAGEWKGGVSLPSQ